MRRAQNIFIRKNINCHCVTIIITLAGIEKLQTDKNKKKTTKQSEEYFFKECSKKTSTNTEIGSSFPQLNFNITNLYTKASKRGKFPVYTAVLLLHINIAVS